jgi:hypothetical protein
VPGVRPTLFERMRIIPLVLHSIGTFVPSSSMKTGALGPRLLVLRLQQPEVLRSAWFYRFPQRRDEDALEAFATLPRFLLGGMRGE